MTLRILKLIVYFPNPIICKHTGNIASKIKNFTIFNTPMAKLFLSKSDFKVAMTCPTKLYYRKLKYPTTMDGNEFMEMLAEGGYMVGKLATLLYPEGVDLSNEGSPEKSAVSALNNALLILKISSLFVTFYYAVNA